MDYSDIHHNKDYCGNSGNTIFFNSLTFEKKLISNRKYTIVQSTYVPFLNASVIDVDMRSTCEAERGPSEKIWKL